MRRLIGVVAALAVLLTGTATRAQTDPLSEITREKQHLVGAVAVVLVEEAALFQGAQGPVEGSRIRRESLTFGPDGLLQGWVRYDPLGRPESTIAHTYENGILIRKETYGPTGSLIERILYATDPATGRTTGTVESRTGTLKKTIVYERDAAGRLLTVTEFDAAGALSSKLVYTVAPGEERVDTVDKDGKLTSWSIEKLDAGGRTVEATMYSQGSEQPFFTMTFAYDERGNVTLAETTGQGLFGFFFAPSGGTGKTSYEYTLDATGNWVKKVESTWVPKADNPYWQPRLATYRTFIYYQ